jgi:hypothetical protein
MLGLGLKAAVSVDGEVWIFCKRVPLGSGKGKGSRRFVSVFAQRINKFWLQFSSANAKSFVARQPAGEFF